MQNRLRPPTKLIAEINTVPFTDVVLVLLVIFMVTTPFLFQGAFQVKLPRTAAPSPNLPETITITVTRPGDIYVDDVQTSLENLASYLQIAVRKKTNAIVMINADKDVSHGKVTEVMSKAYVAGVSKVGISVEMEKQETVKPEPGLSAPKP
jgi:biopolymer transport protein ExbD